MRFVRYAVKTLLIPRRLFLFAFVYMLLMLVAYIWNQLNDFQRPYAPIREFEEWTKDAVHNIENDHLTFERGWCGRRANRDIAIPQKCSPPRTYSLGCIVNVSVYHDLSAADNQCQVAVTVTTASTTQETLTRFTCDEGTTILLASSTNCKFEQVESPDLDRLSKSTQFVGFTSDKYWAKWSGQYGILYEERRWEDRQYNAILFAGRIGYSGQTKQHLFKLGPTINSLNTTFAQGHPFEYNLEHTSYERVVSHTQRWDMSPAGLCCPMDCAPLFTVAVIVPFRNRHEHLWIFLNNMIPFLRLQHLGFQIFVIDQQGSELFNRAALMNIGYEFARQHGDFDCYVFHDVDAIPEDVTNLYICETQPRHLVVSRSSNNYKVWNHNKYFGGGIMMTPRQIERINGFSNKYFGWGGEDDDMMYRILREGYNISRYPVEVASYVSLEHQPHNSKETNPHSLVGSARIEQYVEEYHKLDGLSSMNYTVLDVNEAGLYTHVKVRIPGPKTLKEHDNLWGKRRGIKKPKP